MAALIVPNLGVKCTLLVLTLMTMATFSRLIFLSLVLGSACFVQSRAPVSPTTTLPRLTPRASRGLPRSAAAFTVSRPPSMLMSPLAPPLARALSVRGGASRLLEFYAPLAGTIVANLMFLAPVSAVLAARKDEALGEVNPVPFVSIIGNCVAWLGYGFATGNNFVFASNLPGTMLGFWFTLSAVAFASKAQRLVVERMLLSYLFVLISAGWVAVKSTMPAKDVFGYVANGLLLLYYAAPLSTLAKVVRQKSSASINVPLSFMSVVNGGLWSSYGLAVSDVYIWVPNVIGVVLSSVQLALCGLFKR